MTLTPYPQLLLALLEDEKRNIWEQVELSKKLARGRPPKSDRWKEKFTFPASPDPDDLPTLPEGWSWVSAGQVCEPIENGNTPQRSKMAADEGEIPFVKVYNLTKNGELDFSVNPTFIDKDTHQRTLTKSRAQPGDVLLNIVGPPLGKVSVLPDAHPEWNFNQAIVMFRPLSLLNRRYLTFYLLSADALRRMRGKSQATAGQFNISVSFCRGFPVPFPDLKTQVRIVAKIEALTERSRRAREALAAIPSQLERFRQSVLAAAFRGDLTKDWREKNPDVEPASVLLERIRKERRRRWEEAESAKMKAKGRTPKNDKWKEKYKEPAPVDTTDLPELPEGWSWASVGMIGEVKGGKRLPKGESLVTTEIQ